MHISLKSLLRTPEGYLFDNQSLKTLIVPLVIEQILSIAVGAADTMMVSSAGEAAVSAVSLVDNVFVLLINLFAALATGGAVISGQYLGRRRPDVAQKAAEQLTLFTAVFSVLIMALTYFFRSFILNVVFGKIEADVMSGCTTYLMIVAASIPFIALYNTGAALFRAMGDSRTAMFTALFMNGINLVGNSILIFGLKMGVAGAAIPTLISRIAAAILILSLLRNPKKIIHVSIPFPLRLDFPLLKKILGIGIPNGLENSMFQLGKILVLSMVSGFGTASIAANAVSNTIGQFQILSGAAIGFAVLTVSARCVGAGSYEQVRYYTRKLLVNHLLRQHCSQPARARSPAVFHTALQPLPGGRRIRKRHHFLPCILRHDDLAALLYPAKHPAGSLRRQVSDAALYHLNVGVPHLLQLAARRTVRTWCLRHLGCHDDRLAVPRDLLHDSVSGA